MSVSMRIMCIIYNFEAKVWREEVGACTGRHVEASLMDSFISVRYDPSAKDHGQRNDQV